MLSFFRKKISKRFKDPLNTVVFTTKFVIRESKTITSVWHYEDDTTWQFSSDDEYENFESVAMIVTLGQVISKDKSILEIADLPLGYVAT